MTKAFATGSIVYLKSGSPPLTVCDPLTCDIDLIDVHWFKGEELMREAIHKDCLTFDDPKILMFPLIKPYYTFTGGLNES